MLARNSVSLLSGLCLFIFCCQNKSKNNAVNAPYAGNWLSKNYFDSLNMQGMPSKVKSIPFSEIVISSSADSIFLIEDKDRFQTYKINRHNPDSFTVMNFKNMGEAHFFYNENTRELIIVDSKKQKHVYFKPDPKYAVKIINRWRSASELFYNEYLIAGNYYLLNTDLKPSAEIAFTSYGKITGLPGYTDFNLCLWQHCAGISPFDLITLSQNNIREHFIWEWKNDTLIFFSSVNTSKKNEASYFTKGAEIFKFIKAR